MSVNQRRILIGVVLFSLVGWGMWRLKQQQPAEPHPGLSALVHQAAEIQKPLREACGQAAQISSRPPANDAERERAMVQLRQARAVTANAEAAFRRLAVPPELAGVPEVQRALAAKARMAALSTRAIEASMEKLQGKPGAEKRVAELQAEANHFADTAAALFRKADTLTRAFQDASTGN